MGLLLMDKKVKKVLFVCLCFMLTTSFRGTAARKNVARKNLEVKTHLRRLNKVPTKSIKRGGESERSPLQLRFPKLVKISGFPGRDSDFEFVRFFLENVVALERTIIQPGNDLFPRPAPGGYEIAWRKNVGILTKQVLDEELPGHIELVVLD